VSVQGKGSIRLGQRAVACAYEEGEAARVGPGSSSSSSQHSPYRAARALQHALGAGAWRVCCYTHEQAPCPWCLLCTCSRAPTSPPTHAACLPPWVTLPVPSNPPLPQASWPASKRACSTWVTCHHSSRGKQVGGGGAALGLIMEWLVKNVDTAGSGDARMHTGTCAFKHTYTHARVHAHTHIHTRTHAHTRTLIHTYTHTQTHKHTHTQTRTHTHNHACTHTHTHTHTHTTHIQAHTHTITHAHTHIHTHTYTHMHA